MMLLRISLLFLLTSCQWGRAINFDANVYGHDYVNQYIESADRDRVYCNEPEFHNFVSISKDKLLELAEIIKRARLPKEAEQARKKIIDEITKLVK